MKLSKLPDGASSGRKESLDKYNNSEKRRAAERRYRERHRERLRERCRKWNAENADRRKEISRASLERNRERRAALGRQWYEANKERKSLASKAWWENAKKTGKAAEYVVKRRQKQSLTPFSRLVSAAKSRARKAGLEFNLTNDWANGATDGTCAISGIPFVIAVGKPSPFSPSIDRIDQTRGYTTDNCRIVLWAVNRFRGEDSDEVLLHIAEAIYRRALEKKEG